MSSSSIFLYSVCSEEALIASRLFEAIQQLADDASYFQMQLLSPKDLNGEYIAVRNIQESFYNFETHELEDRVVSKVTVVYFDLRNNQLEIWGNKSYANKLTALFSKLLGGCPITALEVSLQDVIERMKPMKIKVSKVSFKDFLFSEDIVGSFNVDLNVNFLWTFYTRF